VTQAEQENPEDFIWGGTVDGGRFEAHVRPTDESYVGDFTVVVVETGEKLIDEKVTLSYGAIFGPDIGDVTEWTGRTVEAVDAWLRAHGETPPED
jgi:hypothetical protein